MRIFVGNLALNTSNDELNDLFEPYGTVTSCSIYKDRQSGAPRGFGFVLMPNQAEAKAAIAALDNKVVHGQPIHLADADARPRGGDSGG
jgi:RNA recognition motif-containing protein